MSAMISLPFFSLQGLCLCISCILKVTSACSTEPSESMYLVNRVPWSLENQPGRGIENDTVYIISNNIEFCLSYLPNSQFLTFVQFLSYF